MRHNNLKALGFDTLRLEGSLFVADYLEKAAAGLASRQGISDYRVPRGLRLNDEYGRAFQIAGAVWSQYETKAEKMESCVVELFRDALGYTALSKIPPVTLGDRSFPLGHLAFGKIPLVIGSHGLTLDTSENRFSVEGSGSRKKSPFQMTQEYLNAKVGDSREASGTVGWAIVTNGESIRLLRSSPAMARPSYLEFDLGTIMRERRFPEFQMLWRILHASRADSEEGGSIWETWRQEGESQGTRVREGLKAGVTGALLALGSGFLRYEGQGNARLRAALDSGSLSREDYFHELLRLIYRFLFVFTIEERGLVHAHPGDEGRRASHELYERGYSLRRLRDKALRRSGYDRHGDQWEGVAVLFRAFGKGEVALDLPALGGLFAQDQCPTIDACGLSNHDLLSAMESLRWAVAGNARTVVDYRNMDSEELGSVYESLLELVPTLDLAARSFGFVGIEGEEGSTAGNARKTSGSYYTPDSLVQELIKSALEPVIEARLKAAPEPAEREAAILGITVIDPSCGSGHFLLAAARKLAEALALARSEDGSVLEADYRHALREVIAHGLYGVDLNPMAVELARTSLWLEGYEPGRPLSFIDHHIRCGNSLVGVLDFDVLKAGIPDGAYVALSGDDASVVRRYKKRNADEKKANGQGQLFESPILSAEAGIVALKWKLDNIPNDDLESIGRKRAAFESLLSSPEYRRVKLASDIYTAAFFCDKGEGSPIPTTADLSLAALGHDESPASRGVNALARYLGERNRFFHWRLEFPEVFAKGGFDCVLGNPPWERIKLQEEEFFAARHAGIATAKNKAGREKLIEELRSGNLFDKDLHAEFIRARKAAEAASVFAHVKGDEGGRYPLTGIGDVNTYALFAETILGLRQSEGRAGFIVPSGIATDDSTKSYFAQITTKGKLVSLFDFENSKAIFPSVHRSYRFCLLTIGAANIASLAFFLTDTRQLGDERRRFSLRSDEFALLNPNTLTCPVFRSARDAEITKKIYRQVPVLIEEAKTSGESDKNPWGISFQAMFHMSNDSSLFHDTPDPGCLLLYEAKMIHQFDHRWATYEAASGVQNEGEACRDVTIAEKADPGFSVRPRYWVSRPEVIARIAKAPRGLIKAWLAKDAADLRAELSLCLEDGELHALCGKQYAEPEAFFRAVEDVLERRSPRWLMGWRDICRATDERTVIASVMPRAGVGNNLPLMLFATEMASSACATLISNLGSVVLDFVARHKAGGTHMNYFIYKQLPILPPSQYSQSDISFILPRVLELTYTACDLEAWAADIWNNLDGAGRLLLLEAHHAATWRLESERLLKEEGIHRESIVYSGAGSDELEKMEFSPTILPPFPFHPERRAEIRAELDARYARLYGLTRDELRYILDPADVMGEDYPSETFRVLKNREVAEFGEYRTGRLVLEAWDREDQV
ncbi:MAG TPA: N-6 DNA methylase [Rectinemataceae bacterium]|nr:N-6 DNA methylase [Rectinemataceae bacterium]